MKDRAPIAASLRRRQGRMPISLVEIAAFGPGLGRIDIHRIQIMAAARWTKPRKWMALRSYRVAKRRKCLSLLKHRSMRLRAR